MSIILNIDTSSNAGHVSISRDGMILEHLVNGHPSEHASFLQPAIKALFKSMNMPMNQIDAVAISNGPGSYTGLRVGLASAKGICYSLKKPLITINSLLLMASAVQKAYQNDDSNILFCPMLDARRMEVFTAIYDQELNEVVKPCAMIINNDSFRELLHKHKIVFFGNGSEKIKEVITHQNAVYTQEENCFDSLAAVADDRYKKQMFSDLAYCEPYYLKEFFNG